MMTETYRGVKLKAVKGKGADWGYVKVWVGGVPQGKELGMDEAKALQHQHGYIDHAIATADEEQRYSPEWYPPAKPVRKRPALTIREVTGD